jgi:hypothetical protein
MHDAGDVVHAPAQLAIAAPQAMMLQLCVKDWI